MTELDALDDETLRQIARMSGIEIPEAEHEDLLAGLRERLEANRRWRERDLGFTFDDGFDYVPAAHVHRHRWDVPTPMNGCRGSGTTDRPSGASDGDA